MVDTIPVEDSSPLLQGDILVWPNRYGVWDRYGVVLTADCDIENDKSHGLISYVPLLTFSGYVQEVIFNSIKKQESGEQIESIWKQINKLNRENHSDAPLLTKSDIIDWVMSEDGALIAEAIGCKNRNEITKLSRKIEIFRAFATLPNAAQDYTEAINSLKIAYAVKEKGKQDAALKIVQDKIKSSFDNLPESTFLITSVQGSEDSGLIAMLSHLRQTKRENIYFLLSEIVSDDHALRFSRLEKDYKYGVAQRFGHLFSRIGFDIAYDRQCEAIISRFSERPLTSGESK
ncbi:hypothetical protein [Azospirillum brasilense]|uniref:hypothetical protein n=1 Tax=Azospirillum brasilense TaxID=192 RepID=UPI0010C0CA08|nr:hypothetical protein [Azospirillum brasilense]